MKAEEEGISKSNNTDTEGSKQIKCTKIRHFISPRSVALKNKKEKNMNTVQGKTEIHMHEGIQRVTLTLHRSPCILYTICVY